MRHDRARHSPRDRNAPARTVVLITVAGVLLVCEWSHSEQSRGRQEARHRTHNPTYVGSNPTPATIGYSPARWQPTALRSPTATLPVRRRAAPGTLVSACQAAERQTGVPAKVLMAMAFVESGYRQAAVGDGGRSHGWFQIQVKLHNLTVQQARDPKFAAFWTARQIARNPNGLWAGVKAHNGSGPMADRYVKKVRAIAAALEDKGHG